MKLNLKFPFVLLFVMLLAIATAGCRNTARGVGQDVERAGEKIQEKTR